MQFVAAMQRALQRMELMVNDLSEATYLQHGQVVLNTEPVQLCDFLPDLLEHDANILDTSRLQWEIPTALPAVAADPYHLERILVALLLNAQKYSAPPAPIRLSTRRQQAEVIVSVHDRGQGIPAEALPHLFELFYRVEQGRKAEGLGLGLYITRLLVEAHGGHIWGGERGRPGEHIFLLAAGVGGEIGLGSGRVPTRTPARARARARARNRNNGLIGDFFDYDYEHEHEHEYE